MAPIGSCARKTDVTAGPAGHPCVAPEAGASPREQGTALPFSVLIVDDDPGTQRVLSVLIEVEDMLSPTDQAYSGAEALHHVATRCPDVIICDVNMPGMSGLQALPLLREACPNAVIALSSAHPMARTGLQLGANAVFDKSSTDPSVMLSELLRLCQVSSCADA